MKLVTIMTAIPQGVQTPLTGAAVTGAWATVLGLIQSGFGAAAAVLSFVWLALQIYAFLEKRRGGKKNS